MLPPYRVKVSVTKVTHFTPMHFAHGNQYRWNKQNTAESQRLKIYVQNVHHSREHMHSNNYATAQSLMVSVTVSSLGATQLHFLEPGDYYRNTVLLNMLMLDIRSVFWDYDVFSKMGHQHIVHVTRALSPCCRVRRQSLSLQICGHLIRQIWIWWTTASAWGMLQERVYRSWIHDVSWKNVESWKKVCWGSGGC